MTLFFPSTFYLPHRITRAVGSVLCSFIIGTCPFSVQHSLSHADTSAPGGELADDTDPRTAITTSAQKDVVRAFTQTLHDYETADTFALNFDLTLQALDAYHKAPREAFIETAKDDVAQRGVGTLVNPRVMISSDRQYAWLRTRINYSKGGTNTILVLMIHDMMRWKVATIQLT